MAVVLRFIRNMKGNLVGYSGCSHCGDRWNWKEEHIIPYDDRGSGMFPFCEECYQKLSPQKRYDYCMELWDRWGQPADKVDFNMISKNVGLTTGD